MIRFFPLAIVLQIFCLYHAYKNNNQQKWFLLIIFLPFIGSLIYLYYHFFNRVTAEAVEENITSVVHTNYKIEKLEKEVRFSGTVTNKTLLADEYVENGNFEKAIFLYTSCLKGTHADDPDILMRLVKAHYLNQDYPATIKYGVQIENEKIFQNAEERIAYAWALNNIGEQVKAEQAFEAMDHQFSNYKNRLEFCNFLIEHSRKDEAKEKLLTMTDEIEHMGRAEKRSKRQIYNSIQALLNTL